MEDDNRKIFFIIIAVIAIGGLAFGGYYLAKRGDKVPVVSSPVPTSDYFSCGVSTVSDIESNIYNTVKIGDQCWLRQNIKVEKNPRGDAINRYCYDNNSANCDAMGGLYDWNTAMDDSRIAGAQGICPNGWHIPKDSEWYILEKGLANGSCSSTRTEVDCDPAGAKLKEYDSAGFGGALAGYYNNSSGSFYGKGAYGYFWTSLESGDNAWSRNLSLVASTVYRNSDSKDAGFSVRCLKD